MKNRLSDLNNHLFAQIERLSDESLTPEQIENEVKRTNAIVDIADQIIGNAGLQFKAAQLVAEHGRGIADMIPESIAGRMIEHRPEAKPTAPKDSEQQAIEDRRRERELAEEREEWRRQEREKAGNPDK